MSQPSSRNPSRSASVASERDSGAPEAEQQPRRQSKNRRSRSRAQRSPSAGPQYSSEEEPQVKPKRRRGKGGGLPAVDEVEDIGRGNANNQVARAVPQQQQQPVQQQDDGGKADTLKLRLDLNLSVEVKVTAKLHGDLTLSLL
ncbi:hypothetical protein HWV62_24692 [Athelia sp. TMB]|nr:hypothetical protein HWV62_24692 [Athelia sp. TMB]